MDQSGSFFPNGAIMFRGIFEHTIDEKGRISLPSRIRDVFTANNESTLIITTHYSDPCLVAYSLREWQLLEQQLKNKSQFDPRIVRFMRLYVAPATECNLDRHGRFIVPGVLREHAQLSRDILWVGMLNKLELWDRKSWFKQRQQFEKQVQENTEEIGRDLADLGI